jgi:hypothetical protein
MQGGASKIVPFYSQTTDQFKSNIPNEQKEIFAEKMKNRPPPRDPHPPTISFEYNQPPPPPRKKEFVGDKQMDTYAHATYVRPDISSALAYQNFPNPAAIYAAQGYIPPVVVKNYSINNDTITGDQQKLSIIYEDTLPSRKFNPSYTTLGERLNDYQFIRSAILNNSDGNDIDLGGMSTNSLGSHIKIDILNVNPYNSYKLSKNPFKGLPKDFLLYRSGYPIRHNEMTGKVDVAKDSTSINVRLYKMLEGSWKANKLHENKNQNRKKFFDYDEWREVAFYEYIREKILKKKVSPNFVNIYGYFISENSTIDYDKINYEYTTGANNTKPLSELQKDPKIKSNEPYHKIKSVPLKDQEETQDPNKKLVFDKRYITPIATINKDKLDPMTKERFNGFNDITYQYVGPKDMYGNPIPEYVDPTIGRDKTIFSMNQNKHIIEVNPDAYLGKSMVILTESPTYSIFGWASKVYTEKGNIYEMISRGNHSIEEWKNILFQLMVALYVMQIHKIYIDKFDIEKNVFIKDLSYRGQTKEYWKYKVDGVDYYIPNLGYLVMIDSNYADLSDDSGLTFEEKKENHKLHGDLFYSYKDSDKKNYDDTIIKNKVFDMFINAMDPNNFGRYAQNYGIVQPPDEIRKLMSDIINEASRDKDKNIEKYIITYMREFIHNRVGTYLKKVEVPNVRENDTKRFEKGDIVVYKIDNDTYKFVMYLTAKNGDHLILTKDKHDQKNYGEELVDSKTLVNYVRTENIAQNFKPNEEDLSEEGLLETFVVS